MPLCVCVHVSVCDISFHCLWCSYMVDAADHEKMDAAKAELLQLLEKPQLAGIPVSGGGGGGGGCRAHCTFFCSHSGGGGHMELSNVFQLLVLTSWLCLETAQ